MDPTATLAENIAALAEDLRAANAEPGKRLVVFAGAALSMAGPSYLPPAAPLVKCMLEALLRGSAAGKTLRDAGLSAAELISQITLKPIVPEALYQHVADIAGLGRLIEALRVLDSRLPNPNHRLIAALASQGLVRLVVTTNFDTLLERALQHEQQPFEVRVGAEASAAWIAGAFAAGSRGSPVRIWKVHGDMADADDPARHHRIVTTLNQIGPAPSRPIAEGIRAGLDGRAVLMLGYSANDRDLAAELAAIRCRRLYWNVLSIDEQTPIHRIMSAHGAAASWLVGDINEALGALASAAGLRARAGGSSPTAFAAITPDEWQNHIVGRLRRILDAWDDDPSRRIEPPRKMLVVATILRIVGLARAAVALGRALLPAEGTIEPEILFELGRSCIRLGDAAGAQDAFSRALQGFEKQGNDNAQALALIELAGLALANGAAARAQEQLARAVRLAERADNPVTQADGWSELAHQHKMAGQIEQSRTSAEKARVLYARVGSVAGEAKSAAFLGGLAQLQGNAAAAETQYRLALELDRLAGDARGEATALNRLGEIRREQRDWAGALALYEEAAELYTRAGDRDGQAAALNNIGIVLTELGMLERAEQLLKESIAIHEQIVDVEGLGQAWLNLGNVHLKRKDWRAAAAAYERALLVFSGARNAHGMALAQHNYGGLLLLGAADIARALDRYRAAAELFAASGDMRSAANTRSVIKHLEQHVKR
jgi:tetratricopeptide (TPR) repeat protein